jgi:hypothetical protein
MSMHDLRMAFRSAVARARYSQRVQAKLGLPSGVGTFTFTVPGGNGFTYVRIYQGNGMQIAKAIDRLGVSSPTDDDKPVWLDRDKDGNYIIVEFRYEGS